jgi:hypothetical protein
MPFPPIHLIVVSLSLATHSTHTHIHTHTHPAPGCVNTSVCASSCSVVHLAALVGWLASLPDRRRAGRVELQIHLLLSAGHCRLVSRWLRISRHRSRALVLFLQSGRHLRPTTVVLVYEATARWTCCSAVSCISKEALDRDSVGDRGRTASSLCLVRISATLNTRSLALPTM